MADVELSPASSFGLAELAAAFTAGYAGYAVPIQVDEATLRYIVASWDLDLTRSRVALRGGEPVGLAMLGVRSSKGWVGGLGVVAEERRHGIGRMLMEALIDEARAAGLAELTLEVLDTNEPAIRLYEELGFRHVRHLEVWSLPGPAPSSAAAPAAIEDAHAWIRAHRREPEPWQRADETVAHLELEGLVLADRGAALVRVANDRASVLQLAALDEDAAAELLCAARARGGSLGFLNVPQGHVASGALRRLGGRLDGEQLELSLALN